MAEKYHILKNEAMEKTLLGALIYFNRDLEEIMGVFEVVQTNDFYDERHRVIYEAIKRVTDDGNYPDLILVDERLKKMEAAKDYNIHLFEYVNAAEIEVVTSFQLAKYARDIKRYSILRNTYVALMNAAQKVDSIENPVEYLAEVETKILDILTSVKDPKPTDVEGILKLVQEEIAHNELVKNIGFQSGFNKLDAGLGGLLPSHCWVIGGYTGTGKSLFVNQLILNILPKHKDASVVLFSTEMDNRQIMERMCASLAEMSPLKLKRGMLTPEQNEKKKAAFKQMREFQDRLHIIDDAYSLDEIRLKAKKEKLQHKVNIVVVDFIQNIRMAGDIYERMSRASIELQALAKELNCVMIIMSQISQEGQKMGAEGGVISFKGAGELAAIADVALWMETIKDESNEKEKTLKVWVRKARHAPSNWYDVVKIHFGEHGEKGGRVTEVEDIADAAKKIFAPNSNADGEPTVSQPNTDNEKETESEQLGI